MRDGLCGRMGVSEKDDKTDVGREVAKYGCICGHTCVRKLRTYVCIYVYIHIHIHTKIRDAVT